MPPDLLAALVQTTAVSLIFWWLLGCRGRGARWPAVVAVVLVAVDLGMANRWMVACAPADLWQQRPKLATLLKDIETWRHSGAEKRGRESFLSQQEQPFRVYRQRLWTPGAWRTRSSPSRLVDAAHWDHDTLWPKYNLAPGVPLAEVHGTMSPYDYETFVARRGPPPFATKKTPDPFSVSNVKYFILRGGERLPGAVRIGLDREAAGLEDVSVWYQPRHLPRAWIVHQLDVAEPLASPAAIRRRTDRVFFTHAGPRDLLKSALVELDLKADESGISEAEAAQAEAAQARGAAAASSSDAEICTVTQDRKSVV